MSDGKEEQHQQPQEEVEEPDDPTSGDESFDDDDDYDDEDIAWEDLAAIYKELLYTLKEFKLGSSISPDNFCDYINSHSRKNSKNELAACVSGTGRLSYFYILSEE